MQPTNFVAHASPSKTRCLPLSGGLLEWTHGEGNQQQERMNRILSAWLTSRLLFDGKSRAVTDSCGAIRRGTTRFARPISHFCIFRNLWYIARSVFVQSSFVRASYRRARHLPDVRAVRHILAEVSMGNIARSFCPSLGLERELRYRSDKGGAGEDSDGHAHCGRLGVGTYRDRKRLVKQQRDNVGLGVRERHPKRLLDSEDGVTTNPRTPNSRHLATFRYPCQQRQWRRCFIWVQSIGVTAGHVCIRT